MTLSKEKSKHLAKTCCSDIVSTTNPSYIAKGLNQGLRGGGGGIGP
jgi:hypothetical protein